MMSYLKVASEINSRKSNWRPETALPIIRRNNGVGSTRVIAEPSQFSSVSAFMASHAWLFPSLYTIFGRSCYVARNVIKQWTIKSWWTGNLRGSIAAIFHRRIKNPQTCCLFQCFQSVRNVHFNNATIIMRKTSLFLVLSLNLPLASSPCLLFVNQHATSLTLASRKELSAA